jgi:hypothetical protein
MEVPVTDTSANAVYAPSGTVAARYGVSIRTIDRWLKDPKLGFPLPIVIRDKRFWAIADLEQFERSRAGKGAP